MMNNFTHSSLKSVSPLFLISQLIKRVCHGAKTKKIINNQTLVSTFLYNKKKLNLSIFTVSVFLMVGVGSANAVTTYYTHKTGNWNNPTTWTTTSGSTTDATTYPKAGDIVIIERTYTVTVTADAACSSINASTNNYGALTFGGAYTLTVSGSVQLGGNNTNKDLTINFANGSTLDAGSVVLGYSGQGCGIIDMTNGGALRTGSLAVNTATGNSFTPGSGTIILDATNTLPATIFTTFNNLTCIAGTTTMGVGLTINGDLTIPSGTTFNANNFNTTVSGNWINNGGTFTAGTGTVTFTGNTTAINGTAATQTFNNIILNKTAGQDLNVSGSTTTLNVGGTFTETLGDFNAPPIMNVTGNFTLAAGTFTAGTNLSVAGNWNNNGGTFTSGTGTVTMSTSAKTIGGSVSTTFNNLTLGTGNGEDFSLGFSEIVNGVLTIKNNTLFTLGSNNLTLGASASIGNMPNMYNSCMIVADGTGQVQKMITGNGSFTFPIGDNTNGAYYYSPITLNFTQGIYAAGAYVGVNVTNAVHPQNLNSANYFKRYWTVSQTGISAFLCNVTATFGNANELVGDWTVQNPAEYVNGGWLPYTSPSSVSGNPAPYTLAANGVSFFGDFTAMGFPSITINSAPSSTFTYVHGVGPSIVQQLYVYGKNLTGSFIVTPPADYEISLDNINFYSTPLTVPQSPTGSVNNALIYIRLKAGLAIGSYNENITCSTVGLVATLVPVTGTVTSPTSLYCPGQGQNNSSYYISRVRLNTLDNNSNSCSANGYGDFTSSPLTTISVGISYTLTVNVNTISSGKVSAKAWIDWNNNGSFTDAGEEYDLGNTTTSGVTSITPSITAPAGTSLGATRMRIASNYYNSVYPPCYGQNGEVEDYTINIIDPIAISTSSLNGFNYAQGSGPSGEQSFTVKGSGLAANIVATAPSNFEISTVSGGVFSTNPITLTQTGGNINLTTIYVRLKAGLSAGGYGPQDITLTSTGSTSKAVTCIGYVIPSVIVGGGGSYCINDSIKLTSSVSSGATSYYWSGPNNFYKLNTLNASIPVTSVAANAGAYTLTADYLTGSELIVDGGFESEPTNIKPTDFSSDYTYASPSAGGSVLKSSNTYTITNTPISVHTKKGAQFDYTSNPAHGGTYQLVVHGSNVDNYTFWSQSVPVEANSNYQFSYWIQNVAGTGTGVPSAKIQLDVNGSVVGSVYTAPAAAGQWQQWVYNINTGNATTLILELVNPKTDGNQFAVDDISMKKGVTASAWVNVSVNSSFTLPTVTIAADTTSTVSAGTSVTFTATPTNGGHPPIYQWKVNGIIPTTGVTTAETYTYIPANGDKITCEMTSTSTCKTGSNPYISNAITMTVATATKNYWTGTVDSNWSNPLNWTANAIPASGDNVEFSTTTTIPWGDASRDLIVDNADKVINNLTNLSSKNLIIPSARCLTVNGTITTNGDVNQIQLKADQTGAQQNGSLVFHDTSKVNGTVEMYSIAKYNATGTLYNGVTYNYTWQYFGIPIESIPADPTFYDSWVRRWNETGADMASHWVQLGNTDQLNPFYGYEITQQVTTGKTIVFQGQLVNRNFTTPILAKTSTALFPGQQILANPYTAAIDIKKFLTTNTNADFDGSVYLYSTGSYADWGNAGGQGGAYGTSPGQYQVVNNTAGTGGLPSQIPSMQGFLVQVVTGSQPNSTITFNYNDVVKNSELQRVKGTVATSAEDMVSTKIEVTGANYSDKMWIFTDSTFTKKYDKGWDGTKMYGSALAPQLYAVGSDGIYQINAVNDMSNTVLGFERGVDDTYTFTFTHENTDTRYSGIYLVDSIEHKTIDITASGSQYEFTVDSNGIYPNRFKIITRSYEQNDPEVNSKIKVFNSNGMVFVQNLSSEQGQFSLYDMAGRQLNRTLFGPNSVTQVCTVAQQGIYVGKAATNSEKNTKRFIVQ